MKNIDWSKWITYILDLVSGIFKKGSVKKHNKEVAAKVRVKEAASKEQAKAIQDEIARARAEENAEIVGMSEEELIKHFRRKLGNK